MELDFTVISRNLNRNSGKERFVKYSLKIKRGHSRLHKRLPTRIISQTNRAKSLAKDTIVRSYRKKNSKEKLAYFCLFLKAISSSSRSACCFLGAFRGFFFPPSRPDMFTILQEKNHVHLTEKARDYCFSNEKITKLTVFIR